MVFTKRHAANLARAILEMTNGAAQLSQTSVGEQQSYDAWTNPDNGKAVVTLDAYSLLAAAPEDTVLLLQNFSMGIEILEEVLASLTRELEWESSSQGSQGGRGMSNCMATTSLRIRLSHVPPGILAVPTGRIDKISTLSAVGNYVVAHGIVTRLGASRLLQWQHNDSSLSNQVMACHSNIGNGMVDYQEARLQDLSGPHHSGAAPSTLPIVLLEDLVGKVEVGDCAVIGGVLYARWQQAVTAGKRARVGFFMEANHVRIVGRSQEEVMEDSVRRQSSVSGCLSQCEVAGEERRLRRNKGNTDEFMTRHRFVCTLAPWLHGLEACKLALLLVLSTKAEQPLAARGPRCPPLESHWSAYQSAASDRSRKAGGIQGKQAPPESEAPRDGRASSHILLVGDPATGKSQLLQALRPLSPHGVLVHGAGTTRAGLTCSVSKEEEGVVVEAGALALADGGICCIDGFEGLKSEEAAALHEAMEQQTLSIAKPGMVTRLKTRCSVVAAMRSVSSKSHSVSLPDLPGSLLSRFDLVFGLKDTPCETIDEQRTYDNEVANMVIAGEDFSAHSSNDYLDVEALKEALKDARGNPLPGGMLPDAQRILEVYFYTLRRANTSAGSQQPSFTIRLWGALLRLAEAHARFMQHQNVEVADAVSVIFLHSISMLSTNVGGGELADAFGPAAPSHLRQLGLHSDITCHQDYVAVEGAVLWMLGINRSFAPAPEISGHAKRQSLKAALESSPGDEQQVPHDEFDGCHDNSQTLQLWRQAIHQEVDGTEDARGTGHQICTTPASAKMAPGQRTVPAIPPRAAKKQRASRQLLPPSRAWVQRAEHSGVELQDENLENQGLVSDRRSMVPEGKQPMPKRQRLWGSEHTWQCYIPAAKHGIDGF